MNLALCNTATDAAHAAKMEQEEEEAAAGKLPYKTHINYANLTLENVVFAFRSLSRSAAVCRSS